MSASRRDVVRLTALVRVCFQRLRAVADALHADLGMTASLRAVLETLHARDAQTVPQIAEAKSVSRQHIQKIVDALLATRHVALRANPDHKRSPLVALTAKGRAAFEAMQAREAALAAALARDQAPAQIAEAIAALERLAASLAQHLPAADEADEKP